MSLASRLRPVLSSVVLFLSLLACGGGGGGSTVTMGGSDKPPIVYGKIRKTTTVDGDTREYYVHVPLKYDGKTAVPVVFMFHGTSGDGEKFYNISGWKEKAEIENILTVYPSSWRYCFTDPDDGLVKNNTKWNDFHLSTILCAGERARDDVKFVAQMISELQAAYNVDARRVYASGFSNGGQFSSRLAVDLSDKLAAVASNAGGLPAATAYTPKRKLPVTYMVGTHDDRYMGLNGGQPLPTDLGALFEIPYFRGLAGSYIATFGLQQTYSVSGVPGVEPVATFPSATGAPANLFHMVVVKDMTHIYPNGDNFPISAPNQLWDFFKPYSLP
jgi:polyhydroxybutyrate depolymerase